MSGEGGREGERPGDDEDAPFPPFPMLCLGLAAQAQVALGLHADPVTKETKVDLDAARRTIDLLSVLEEKTKGNLTGDESSLLAGLLGELRRLYVQVAPRGGPPKGKPS